MDYNNQPKVDDEDDVRIDDNVDQLFEQKMQKLRELGLYDDRMMDKINLIKDMDSNPSTAPKRGFIKRGYRVLGRPDNRPDDCQEFKGDEGEDDGQGFKPIEGGLKWSLPIFKRSRPPQRGTSPPRSTQNEDKDWVRNRDRDRNRDNDRYHRDSDKDRERHRETERPYDPKPDSQHSGDGYKDDYCNKFNSHSNEAIDRKSDNDNSHIYQPSTSEKVETIVKKEPNKRVRFNPINEKPTNFHKFFDNRRSKPEEKKTETITDIEAFIRDCNKKAEKPKPLFDDIDDFIAKANQRFDAISAKLEKTYSS